MSGICKLGNPPHSLEKYKSHANFGKDYSTEHIEKKTATRRLRLKRSKCVQKKCTKTTSRNGIAQGGQVALNREV